MAMGASSSSHSERRRQRSGLDGLEQLRDDLEFDVGEGNGVLRALRVYVGNDRDSEEGEGGGDPYSMVQREEEEREGEGDGEGEGEGMRTLHWQLDNSSDSEDEEESHHSSLRLLARLFAARSSRGLP